MNENENINKPTVPVKFGMVWREYGYQSIDVPAELITDDDEETKQNIIDYIESIWDDIPLPDGDYISESDELDPEYIEW